MRLAGGEAGDRDCEPDLDNERVRDRGRDAERGEMDRRGDTDLDGERGRLGDGSRDGRREGDGMLESSSDWNERGGSFCFLGEVELDISSWFTFLACWRGLTCEAMNARYGRVGNFCAFDQSYQPAPSSR